MKNLFLPLLMWPALLSAQAQYVWEVMDRGFSIATDANNNVFTVDYEYNLGKEMWVEKRDKDGNLLWTGIYDQTDNTKWERAQWVATDHAGNVIVIGTSMSGFSNPVTAASIIEKFDANGNLLWRHVYESSFDGSYTKKCLVDHQNNIYVLGMGSGPAGFVTKVKKFAPDGTALWNWFDADGIGAPQNFKFTRDSAIVISGRSIFGSVNGYARIDLNGNKIWAITGLNSLTVGDVAGDAFGNSYILFTEYIINGSNRLRKVGPSGNQIWEYGYAMAGNKIEVGSDNRPVVSGFPNVNSFGAAFFKTDENGLLLWMNTDADGIHSLNQHSMLVLDKNNDAYLSASTLFNQAVCKVFKDGTPAWTVLGASSGTCYIALGESIYSVFVTGSTTGRIDDPTMNQFVCQPPASVWFTNITPTSIRVNWSAVTGAVNYEVWRKKSTSNTWKVATVAASKTSKNYKNLVCNTSYDFKIRTLCAQPLVSDFTPVHTASTASCRLEAETVPEQISLAPNPTETSVTVELELPKDFTAGHAHVYDLQGRLLISIPVPNPKETLEINLTALPPAMYLLRIVNAKYMFTRQIIKQ